MKSFVSHVLLILILPQFIYSQTIDNENLKLIHGPYLQNLTGTGVTVVWITNKPAVPSVNLGEPDKIVTNYRNSTDGIYDGGGILHRVRIEGLKPGTKYNYTSVMTEIVRYQPYRIYYGDTVSSVKYSFRTLDSRRDSYSFVVFNDIHERSDLLSTYIRKSNISQHDMVFFNGDLINYLQDKNQIFNGFLDTSVYYFAKEIPFYIVRGNHETRGMLARDFKKYFDFPDNRFYYAFSHGDVHFIILDCGEDKPDDNRYYYSLADYDAYRLKELEWLKNHIKSDEFRNAGYRVVLVHMPILNRSGQEHGMQFLTDHFGPVLSEAGIDLLLAGHTHQVEYYSKRESGFGYPVVVSSNKTFLEVEVTGNNLKVIMKNSLGEIITTKDY